jgi:hypothetical protein
LPSRRKVDNLHNLAVSSLAKFLHKLPILRQTKVFVQLTESQWKIILELLGITFTCWYTWARIASFRSLDCLKPFLTFKWIGFTLSYDKFGLLGVVFSPFPVPLSILLHAVLKAEELLLKWNEINLFLEF